jgi:hypothetical protein
MNLLAYFKRPNRPSWYGDLPDFAGKILVIYPDSQEIGGGVLQDAKAVRVGFNVFVVGRRVGLEPPSQQRWSRDTVWTSIHRIAQMLVFDDVESAKRAFERDATEAKPDPA